jgi:hypothetical protein
MTIPFFPAGPYVKGSFGGRWATLKSYVAAVEGAAKAVGATDLVRFTPDAPRCSLVHCHLRAPRATLEAARDATAEATGIKATSHCTPRLELLPTCPCVKDPLFSCFKDSIVCLYPVHDFALMFEISEKLPAVYRTVLVLLPIAAGVSCAS